MKIRSAMLTAVAALVAAPGLAGAQTYQQPTGNPLSSIFSCQSAGNRQAGGAAIGAVLGGVIGNQVADNERGLGTLLGAAAGAAAGSYVGCRMQTADQQRAQAAAQDALNRGQDSSWTNPDTGAYGRVAMVSSQPYSQRQGYNDNNRRDDDNSRYGSNDRYDDRSRGDRGFDNGRYDRPMALNNIRFAPGVQRQSSYYPAYDQYLAPRTVNMRAGPTATSRVLGRMNANQTFDVLGRVRGQSNDWLLVGRNGRAMGYVSLRVVQAVNDGRYDDRYDDRYDGRDNRDGAYRDRQAQNNAPEPMCRTFDQTLSTRDGGPQVYRYTACQTANGQWVVVS